MKKIVLYILLVLLSLPAGRSETAGKDNFAHIDLQTRLEKFLNEYCQSYEQKDLDKFSTFFTLNAIEKEKPFKFRHSEYRKTFNRIDSVEYDIKLKRYATQRKTGLVKIEGIFYFRTKFSGSKTWRNKSGQIFMVLEPDGNSFKVILLDY